MPNYYSQQSARMVVASYSIDNERPRLISLKWKKMVRKKSNILKMLKISTALKKTNICVKNFFMILDIHIYAYSQLAPL